MKFAIAALLHALGAGVRHGSDQHQPRNLQSSGSDRDPADRTGYWNITNQNNN
jgi:hypothetical protein